MSANKRMMAVTILAVVAASLLPAAPVCAGLINFCFYADAPVPDPNVEGTVGVLGGGYWNIGGPFSNRPLNLSWPGLSDSDGLETEVGFSLQTSEWAQNGGSGSGTGPNGALWSRYLYQGGTTNFTISGLTPDEEYDLVLYSHWSGWGDAETGFNIDNAGGGTKIADDDSTKDWDADFVEDENYVRFASVTADGSGQITGQMYEVDGTERWNGFQLYRSVAGLVWDNDANDGQWATANWTGGPPAWPDATISATVNNGATVTVDGAGQAALGLRIADGAVAVADGAGLAVSGLVNVAAGGNLNVASGGTLDADQVMTAGGTVNFDAGALGTINTLEVIAGTANIGGPTIPTVNVGGGELNTSADTGNLTITAGTVNATGPLTATTLTVDGGVLNTSAPLSAATVRVTGGSVNLMNGGNLNVGDMEVSSAVVNTGANVVEVSDRLKLGIMAMSISGGSFQAAGADLSSDTAPRTITAGGGVLDIAVPGGGTDVWDVVNFCFFADSPVPDPNAEGTVGVLGGGHWNIGGPFSNRNLDLSWPDLSDSDDVPTDVDFSLQTSDWAQNGGSGGGTGPNGALWSRYLYHGGTTNFTIGGLTPDSSYDLVLYSHWGDWGDAETGFTIDNDGGGAKIADDDSAKGWDAEFVEDENYVRFASVTANGSGQITGQMYEVNGTERWNGFQLASPKADAWDMSNTAVVVTENTEINSNAAVLIAGDLTITNLPAPAEPTTLILSGAEFNFANVTTAQDATIAGTVLIRGDLNIGDSPGVLNLEGNLELDDAAVYHCEISEWDSTNVPNPSGLDPINDQIKMVAGDASLSGELRLTALTKLHPVNGDGSQWFGEQTRTIVAAGGENSLRHTFVSTPTPLPVDFNAAEWGEGHIGRGVFLTRHHNGGENDVPGVSYSEGAVQVHLFQAMDGDTNGDAILDTGDIFAILGAGSFLTPGEWDWTEGDFDGDSDVDTDDIFAILATGQWGDFTPYYPEPTKASAAKGEADAAVVDLIVNPETGEVSVDTNGAEITGYLISSESGALTGDEAATQFTLTEQTPDQIADMLPLGKAFAGVHDLGSVLSGDGSDLTLTYTLSGQAGMFKGAVKVVPEPGTLAMLLAGAIGLLAAVQRRRS